MYKENNVSKQQFFNFRSCQSNSTIVGFIVLGIVYATTPEFQLLATTLKRSFHGSEN
jgi:hypothetical protein